MYKIKNKESTHSFFRAKAVEAATKEKAQLWEFSTPTQRFANNPNVKLQAWNANIVETSYI